MTTYQSKARTANSSGTIEATIRKDVCDMEDIEPGDQVKFKILDVQKNTDNIEADNQ